MSSFDKVVKLACKPKAAPPKAKYLDPIIAATWSEDGAVHDVCKALSPRFREPNAIVVFKALIVLHTMIRNGATDNVLSYLSGSEVLRLRNVSAGTWEGYTAPENLQNYAVYLDSRIRAYSEIKHDAIRVQAESNRDMRTGIATDDDMYSTLRSKPKTPQPVSRSKTIMGRKLRSMTVEKGLLRETKVVHKMIDTLVECRFYLDDLEDELTTMALRMLVKDLLILFQAGNEGIINLLEHYFEMSHIDAKDALGIYRNFCKQTERVVEYLGVAKKLQNLLNVPIPNLKHAPVSLAGALQEYLDDSNFEQNRREYKANKEAADRGNKKPNGKTAEAEKPPPLPSTNSPSASTSSLAPPNAGKNDTVADFFNSIEEVQPTMFNPQTNSPSTAYFQQQGASNPFQMMMTGQPGAMQMHPTGFQMPQQTGFPGANPFGTQGQQMSHLRPQPTGGIHRPFSSFIPQQMTGMPQSSQSNGFLGAPQPAGSLQPQATGSNPFRQSMMMPQTTGMQMFGVGGPGPGPGAGNAFSQSNPFPSSSWGNGQPAQQGPITSNPTGAMGAFSPSPSFGNMNTNMQNAPPRPASTPLTSLETPKNPSSGPPPAQPVKTHQTGTRNPFGRPASPPPPPVPKQPTLMELAMGMGQMNANGPGQSHTPQPQTQQVQGQSQNQNGAMNSFSFGSSSLSPGATDMSSVASTFSFNSQGNKPVSPPLSTDNKLDTPTFALTSPSFSSFNTATPTGSTVSDSLFSSSASIISTQPTGLTNSTSPPPGQSSLRPQITGMSGLKPFKPSSSFGASLLESLPPIPGSSPNTPAVTGASNGMQGMSGGQNQSSGTSAPSFGPGGGSGFGQQPAGGGDSQQRSLLGTGLRPQMTGGVANPFRASMFTQQPTGAPQGMGLGMTAGNSLFPGSQSQPSFGGAFNPSQPTGGNMNMSQFGGAFGTQQPGQSGQNGTASLI